MPEVDGWVVLSAKDYVLSHSDNCVIWVIDVNCVLVKHCDVVPICIFACTEEGMLMTPGVIWISVAGMIALIRRMNCLIDWHPV